jgi:hypothetical protein
MGRFCHPPDGSEEVTLGDPDKYGVDWQGQEGFGETYTIGLLFNSDEGSLTVYKNKHKLGVASTTIPKNQNLCFTVGLRNLNDRVGIRSCRPPIEPEPEPEPVPKLERVHTPWSELFQTHREGAVGLGWDPETWDNPILAEPSRSRSRN